MLAALEAPDLVFQLPHPFQGSIPFRLGRNASGGFFVVGEQVAIVRGVVPAELAVLPAEVQTQRHTVSPVSALPQLDNFDGLVDAAD